MKMLNSIKIAFRNTLRNKRRTLLSVFAIAIGAFASLLIGSFVASVNQGIQTQVARSSGHLQIHQKGYFDFGVGSIGEYDIEKYDDIMSQIKSDEVGQYINVITPTLTIGGIAGNYAKESSQTFVGLGFVASEQLEMQKWDGYNLNMPSTDTILKAYRGGGLIGQGLAKNLSFCTELNIKGCKEKKAKINTNPIDDDIAGFAMEEEISSVPTVSLLVASAKGAPNIINLPLEKVWSQQNKEMDDRFIAMPLETAQMLLYGKGEKRVNTINIQLKSPNDIALVTKKLEQLFILNDLDLEVIKLDEFNPQINKVVGMFSVIFAFVSIVIGLIVIFTISNTMTMSIMERFNEIGTLRSMGLRRAGVRTYFLLEGSIIGVFGATFGVFLSLVTTTIINNVGLMWTPPSVAEPTKLVFNLWGNPSLIFGIWLFLIVVSVLSSLLPAVRASRMKIVDALRHD
ncbi:MAG TPA: ABC transporter permease [Campylobacterales bacterium]|nr:ABC transporter permease [Campylobacterales bacterium]